MKYANSWKGIRLLSFILLTVIFICSCDTSVKNTISDSSFTVQRTQEVKRQEQNSGQFTMMTWLNEATVEAVKEINQRFIDTYQGSKINLIVVPSSQYSETLQVKINAGEVDIFSTQAIPQKKDNINGANTADNAYVLEWIQEGLIEDLTDKLFVKNYIESSIRDASMYNGRVYSVNTGVVVFNTVFYNKKIFRDNGISEPETWNEFIEICKTLKKKGIAPITVAGKEKWPVDVSAQGIISAFEPDMRAFSKDMYMGVRAFNDTKNMRIWKALWDWVSYFEPNFMEVSYSDLVPKFVQGKAAMLADGSWQAANIQKEDSEFKFGTFIFPGEKPGDAKLCGKYDLAWMIMSKSKNRDIALKWLEFFSRSDNYSYFINQVGWIPTQPPQAKIENEVIKKLLPLARDFQLAQEVVWQEREGAGKMANFNVTYFKSLGGQYDSYERLAEAAQKDWEKGTFK